LAHLHTYADHIKGWNWALIIRVWSWIWPSGAECKIFSDQTTSSLLLRLE